MKVQKMYENMNYKHEHDVKRGLKNLTRDNGCGCRNTQQFQCVPETLKWNWRTSAYIVSGTTRENCKYLVK